MDAIAGMLNQNTQVISPIEGRVLEVKVSAGSVLAVGTPVVAIESDGTELEALVYIPAERGKNVKPGMQVSIEPSTVKREEFGTMVGTIVTVSDFPITPQGMAAVLHNDSLVNRFSHDGAPYAATGQPGTGPCNRQRLSLGGRKGTTGSSHQRNANARGNHHAKSTPARPGTTSHQTADRN